MKHDPDHGFTAAELEASLDRLGVRELEERMELSPLLADAGLGETDNCDCSCRCEIVPPRDEVPEVLGGLRPEESLPDYAK